eukprot:jgi/Astpho2/8813/fgenesh1_pg.00129_%23_14_t
MATAGHPASPGAAKALTALKQALHGLQSGQTLVQLVQGAPNNGELASAVCACMQEACGEAHTPTDAAPCKQDLGSALSTTQVSCLHPRGKQELAFVEDRMVLRTKAHDVAVPYSAIKHVAILERLPGDTKGQVLLFIHLDRSAHIMNGKTPLPAIIMQTLTTDKVDLPHPKTAGGRVQGLASVVLCQIFGIMGVKTFVSPSEDVFRASAGSMGIEAFVKVTQGSLFLMSTAICFIPKPQLFIPLSDVRTVEVARATGGSSTFDLYVYLNDGTAHEFSQISRQELNGVMYYISSRHLKQGHGDEGSSDDNEPPAAAAYANEGANADMSDDEDSDFDPEGSSDGEAKPAARRQQSEGVQGSTRKEEDDAEAAEEPEDSDQESDEDEDSEIELVSDEDLPSAAVQRRIVAEEQALPIKKRKR